jgi:hypothetical protein
MIRVLGTVLFTMFLWTGTPLTISADCGQIYVPEALGINNMPSGATSIIDCENPFGVTETEYPFRLLIDWQNVPSGATHYISPSGTLNYFAPHNYIYGDNLNSYYLHTDSGYELIAQTYDLPADAHDRITPLLPGTYTLVTDTVIFRPETDTLSWRQQLFQKLIPTAHATWVPARFSITFTLAPLDEEEMLDGASNILFLPGIQASRLYTRGMFGVRDQLWTPQNNNDVRQLAMDPSTGESLNAVHTQDIIDTVLGIGSIYKEIGEYFDSLYHDGKINSWASFAYDWRYGVDDIVVNGVMYQEERRFLLDIVERLTWNSFSGKVTIVAHSNGGLLAKALITELDAMGMSHHIDKVIFLASPQQGTPKAIGSILHGYDQSILGGVVLRADVARDTMRNFPSVYGLLPTQSYLEATGNQPIIRFGNNAVGEDRERYGSINTISALDNFMSDPDGRRAAPASVYDIGSVNSELLRNARQLQDRLLERWQAPSHIEVIEVAGVGLPTISGFEYRSYFTRQCTTVLVLANCSIGKINKPVPRVSLLGDQTVMAVSALGYGGEKRSYFLNLNEFKNIKNISHHNFTENESIHNFLSNVFFAEQLPTPFITPIYSQGPQPYIVVGIHSPVTTVITNDQGQSLYVSKEDDFYRVVNEIEGAVGYYFGETTYAVLPVDNIYTIALTAYDEGVVTLEVDHVDINTEQVPIAQVVIEAITASTTILTTIVQTIMTDVLIDDNGDGHTDRVIVRNSEISTIPEIQESFNQRPLHRGGGKVPRIDEMTMEVNESEWLRDVQDDIFGQELSEEERAYIVAVMILLEELLRVLKLYEKAIS